MTLSRLVPLLVLSPLLAQTPLWEEFRSAAEKGGTSLLPDFSWAGYRHGEVPLPKVDGPVFRVGDYGAKPDDAANDAEGIQRAIDACAAAGGGVVLFEKGVYRINEDETATNAPVRVTSSGIVLRGSGSGENGTVLYSPKMLLPVDPKQKYTGRPPILVGRKNSLVGNVIPVTQGAPMNSFTLRVQAGHPFKAGDRISLRMRRTAEQAGAWIASMGQESPRVWDPAWEKGVTLREFHEIAAVEGEALRFAEPLLVPVREADEWTVQKIEFLSNVGVESIRFRGEATADFVHHRSWQDDSGFTGMKAEGLENSWFRDLHFEKMNTCFTLTGSRQVTVRDLAFSGPANHFGYQTGSSTGVLAARIVDRAGHHHGPSLENSAGGTVYLHCRWSPTCSFDSHASNPYATLYDECEGGLESVLHNGGDRKFFIHHLHALVLWNLKVTGSPKIPVNFWFDGSKKVIYPLTFAQILAAGLHGESPNFDGDGGLVRNEGAGAPVTPGSLYLAQLKRRGVNPPADLVTERPTAD